MWLTNTGVKPQFFTIAGSNYKNYESNAGQGKQKVNCGELRVELTLVRIAAHNEKPSLKHGQIYA